MLAPATNESVFDFGEITEVIQCSELCTLFFGFFRLVLKRLLKEPSTKLKVQSTLRLPVVRKPDASLPTSASRRQSQRIENPWRLRAPDRRWRSPAGIRRAQRSFFAGCHQPARRSRNRDLIALLQPSRSR